MPTKKRRVGFIPRIEVLDLITKLSFENNLSNSRIINILVEEALSNRGMFNLNTGKVNIDSIDNLKSNKNKFNLIIKNNNLKDQNPYLKDGKEELLDKEIYAKFIMFLQFEERMKESNL